MQSQTLSLWLILQVVCVLLSFVILRLRSRMVRVRVVQRTPRLKMSQFDPRTSNQ